MKFSNAIVYRVMDTMPLASLAEFEAGLEGQQFSHCRATQELSIGFVPPRGIKNGALVEAIDGHRFMRVMVETKSVPSAIVTERLDERVEQIERETGRKPGNKYRKELKEEIYLSLLPQAFPRRRAINLWLDTKALTLAVDSTTQTRADDAVTHLVAAIPNLALSLVDTVVSPQAAMAQWLLQEPPEAFTLARDLRLEAQDEIGGTVRYSRQALDHQEVASHIMKGKAPTALSMTWDDRVSFTLDEGLKLRGIKLLDTALADKAGAEDDQFDADAALFSGEMSLLLADLFEALGGQAQMTITANSEGDEDQITKPAAATIAYVGDAEHDPLYEQAVATVRESSKGSISYVQRTLSIGYNRAARLLERMENDGIVSPMNAMGTREVIGGAA